jgi:hypothetical protein
MGQIHYSGTTVRMVAGLMATGIAMCTPSLQANASLDSRTVPHPEWAQLSGQIEQTSVVSADGRESFEAILRPTEGGRVTVDFGTAATGSFRPQRDDFIHVRGTAIEREGQVTIVAHEVYAQGKVFSIHRDDNTRAKGQEPKSGSGPSIAPSPAAPTPSR